MRSVVVGAGLAGLSCASYLLASGHDVTVLERETVPGGRVGGRTASGYEFDYGASVLTMPELIFDAMAAAGDADPRRSLELRRVDPTYVGRFADGSMVSLWNGPDRLNAELIRFAGADAADEIRAHSAWLEEMYDAAYLPFMSVDVSRLGRFACPSKLKQLARLVKIGALSSLHSKTAQSISDERLQRMFTFQALYAGVPPAQARAVYSVIAHMDIGRGVYYPRGGMRAVGEAMARAVTNGGGVIEYGCAADYLVKKLGRVIGVHTSSGEYPADAVIITTDYPVTDALLNRTTTGIALSPSAVVGHIVLDRATRASWPSSGHHTLDFGAAWEQTFAEINGPAGSGSLMTDPSFLITQPARTFPDLPANEDVVSILAPCPNLTSLPYDWNAQASEYFDNCRAVLARRGYTGIDSAKVIHLDTPQTWLDAGMIRGTPFSAAHTLRQTGPLRHSMRVNDHPNVLLAGSSTHPGVGIPPVVVSGRLAAEAAVKTAQDRAAR